MCVQCKRYPHYRMILYISIITIVSGVFILIVVLILILAVLLVTCSICLADKHLCRVHYGDCILYTGKCAQ